MFGKSDPADDEQVRAIVSLTAALAVKIREAFLEAVLRLKDKLDLEQIAMLLEQGRVSEAINIVSAEEVAAGMRPVASMISTSIIRAGQAEAVASQAGQLGHLQVVFGVTNPQTVQFLRSYEMTRIRQLSADALAAVRAAVTSGVEAGLSPRQIAADIAGSIGLADTQVQAVANYRRLLENGDRQALQRQLRDRRSDRSVERVARGGKPLSGEQIDRMVDKYRQRFIRYRATTIARTEAQTAANAGRLLAWKQMAADGQISANQVRRDWVFVHDDRVRHAHMTIPLLNLQGAGLDQPFVSELGPIMYPGDPDALPENRIGCRCWQTFRLVEAA